MRKSSGGTVLMGIAFVLFIIVGLAAYVSQQQDCDAAHGVLVKGAFRGVCVEQGQH